MLDNIEAKNLTMGVEIILRSSNRPARKIGNDEISKFK